MTYQVKNNASGEDIRLWYQRNPIIVERRIDDAVFLVNPESDTIYYLNQLGMAVWQLLKQATNISEAVSTIQQAFPDVQPKNIAKDVSKLIKEMSARNLVMSSRKDSLV